MKEGLDALEELKKETRKGGQYYIVKSEKRRLLSVIEKGLNRLNDLEMECNRLSAENQYLENDIKDKEKKEEALEEILALYDKWLGYAIGDFEFFTLLTEIKDKYGLLKEVLKDE